MTLTRDDCFSSPRRPFTRQYTHSTKRFLTITTCKFALPNTKLSCAMAGSSNCDFALLHTWSHWPFCLAFAEARPKANDFRPGIALLSAWGSPTSSARRVAFVGAYTITRNGAASPKRGRRGLRSTREDSSCLRFVSQPWRDRDCHAISALPIAQGRPLLRLRCERSVGRLP